MNENILDQNGTGLRKRHPYNEPLPSTVRWAAMLPSEVRPLALLRRYPRIANLLARQWKDSLECQRYFDDLLIDRRGGRRGFPIEVLADLLALNNFHLGRYPSLPRAGDSTPHSVNTTPH